MRLSVRIPAIILAATITISAASSGKATSGRGCLRVVNVTSGDVLTYAKDRRHRPAYSRLLFRLSKAFCISMVNADRLQRHGKAVGAPSVITQAHPMIR